ncbi:hypothetical protein cce_5249 (plasmid) [Crocosphaera subtropica ATCC 51142]|uniref:Uncharacterized protein n=1 Tax=Crocosphaera subtropica (strain ATCC 51142 / BH68) TaxID=43989 RepID=B1X384_CROS5|nr:hypothetical protein [Crocosphaera subtropica]ACB54595.1 hypothetical protein cce_5249 [Crocosphaera subtropica ATCC 51142]
MNKLRNCLLHYSGYIIGIHILFISPVESANISTSLDFSSDIQISLLRQQNTKTIESQLGWKGFFSLYRMFPDRPDNYDEEFPYSIVYLEPIGNSLNIYNSYVKKPLGQLAGCNTHYCDRAKASLIGRLNFKEQGNQWIVTEASGQTRILFDNARCEIYRKSKTLICKGFYKVENYPMTPVPAIYKFVNDGSTPF